MVNATTSRLYSLIRLTASRSDTTNFRAIIIIIILSDAALFHFREGLFCTYRARMLDVSEAC